MAPWKTQARIFTFSYPSPKFYPSAFAWSPEVITQTGCRLSGLQPAASERQKFLLELGMVLALRRLKQKNGEFKVIFSYIARLAHVFLKKSSWW